MQSGIVGKGPGGAMVTVKTHLGTCGAHLYPTWRPPAEPQSGGGGGGGAVYSDPTMCRGPYPLGPSISERRATSQR